MLYAHAASARLTAMYVKETPLVPLRRFDSASAPQNEGVHIMGDIQTFAEEFGVRLDTFPIERRMEEIVPAVERVILLKDGRIAFDGPKHEMLTDAKLTEVFGATVRVSHYDGRFYARA